jgi:hypothetical protein
MLLRGKLLLLGMILVVLLCFSLVISVEAASMWSQTYGGTGNDMAHSLVATSDGGYAIAGTTSGAGSLDFWLVKTDEFGMVPEYSSWRIPSLMLTATAFILINKKRLLRKRSQQP